MSLGTCCANATDEWALRLLAAFHHRHVARARAMKTSPTIAPATSGPRYDAVLHDWIILPLPDYPETHLLVGIVIIDRKNRFTDGRCIHTSAIVTPLEEIVEGAVAETLNTRYLLGEERERN